MTCSLQNRIIINSIINKIEQNIQPNKIIIKTKHISESVAIKHNYTLQEVLTSLPVETQVFVPLELMALLVCLSEVYHSYQTCIQAYHSSKTS